MRKFLLFISFASCLFSFAQKNPLTDRAFWKKKPSLKDVKTLVKEGNDPTELGRFSFDATSWAIIEDNSKDVVRYLLSLEGNGVNKKTHDGRTYIFWAGYRNNLELMEYLVKEGAKTDIIDSHGFSLVNFMATTGQKNIKLYEFCRNQGADFKKQLNNDNANPALLLIPHLENDNDTLLKYFAKHGVSYQALDTNGNNAFNYCARLGNLGMMKWLIKQGVGLNDKAENAMIWAAQGTRKHKNKLQVFQFLNEMGISPRVTNAKGNTPFHYVAKYGDLKMIQWFLDKKCSYTSANLEGVTPLMNLLSNRNIDAVETLINYNVNVNAKDKKGNSCLAYLMNTYDKKAEDLFLKKAKILDRKKLKYTVIQGNGNNMFHLAVKNASPMLIQKAKDFKNDINLKNKDGLTPLQLACNLSSDLKVIQKLIELGADKSVKTEFGETAYQLAKENELLKNQDLEFLK